MPPVPMQGFEKGPHADELESEVRSLLSRPLGEIPVAKDLPRLAARTTIECTSSGCASEPLPRPAPALQPAPAADPETAMRRQASDLRRVVVTVARHLDGEDAARRAEAVFDEAERRPAGPDLADLAREALHALAGAGEPPETSPAVRVLKAVNQGVVFAGAAHLRRAAPLLATSEYMARDWRGPEGWRVVVSVREGCASVTHTRRERGERWWFEWQLRTSFTRAGEFESARSRVSDLSFEDGVAVSARHALAKALCGGHLYV
eukprot:m51a1_g3308 hypothetical protein (263) ;mRNA; f:326344-327132